MSKGLKLFDISLSDTCEITIEVNSQVLKEMNLSKEELVNGFDFNTTIKGVEEFLLWIGLNDDKYKDEENKI